MIISADIKIIFKIYTIMCNS